MDDKIKILEQENRNLKTECEKKEKVFADKINKNG